MSGSCGAAGRFTGAVFCVMALSAAVSAKPLFAGGAAAPVEEPAVVVVDDGGNGNVATDETSGGNTPDEATDEAVDPGTVDDTGPDQVPDQGTDTGSDTGSDTGAGDDQGPVIVDEAPVDPVDVVLDDGVPPTDPEVYYSSAGPVAETGREPDSVPVAQSGAQSGGQDRDPPAQQFAKGPAAQSCLRALIGKPCLN